MKFLYVQIALVCILGHAVHSEYIWDGREWIWVDKENQQTNVNTAEEGSGSDDRYIASSRDDEDDQEGSGDDRNFVTEEKYPYDDEDDPEGSGDPIEVDPFTPIREPDVPEERNPDNGGGFVYEPPTTTTTPRPFEEYPPGGRDQDPITIDGPETTSTTESPRNPSIADHPNTKSTNRSTSFFAQPGILAAVVGGAVVGLLCAILFVMFVVYRMRKKDEGSYALDEPKRSPTVNSYSKPPSREFYA